MKILARARPGIARHWLSRIEAGLDGFSPTLIGRADKALKSYFVKLSSMKHPASRTAILAAMKTLFLKLDKINADAGGSLLETDERELLVTIIIDGASAAGLKVSEFNDGDPTFQFRNF